MWPWEHLAFGYVLFSAYSRLVHDEDPSGGAAIALALGTQFPDLVDKPLAWSVGLLPSGLSLAHSLLTAVPLCGVTALLAHRHGRADLGRGFCVGYLSHLAGDMLFPLVTSGEARVGFLFWPLVERPAGETAGFALRVAELWSSFSAFLGTPRGRLYLLLEGTLLGAAVIAWALDGFPGVPRESRSVAPTE